MPLPNRILVVDDEAKIRRILVRILSDEGYEVAQVETGEKGVETASEFLPDVVVMDQNLPGMSGQEATEKIVEQISGVKVIMVTAFGAIDRAVDAMRRGAYDYLTKPFDNDELLLRVRRAMESRRLAREVENLREALGERYSFSRILGEGPSLQETIRVARRTAQSDMSVLVEGESGTGKELLVRAIHQESPRNAGPFVAVNCAAVPADLVESTFFGHEKGAFTGAGTLHVGRFEQAHGGTLFLDEISEMPADLQVKLLRALEEGEVSRVGGSRGIPVDVRVVAATNRDAREAVASGVLREDLYHRLAVVSVLMPPLRDRKDDIPTLARHFLALAHEEANTPPRALSPEALGCLQAHDWPGNVRELHNAVRSAALMAEGDTIRECDLPLAMRTGPTDRTASPGDDMASLTLSDAVSALERKVVSEALAEEGGNRTRTAERLGITRKTLLAKIALYGF